MIDRVYHRFFNSGLRKIPEALRFRTIRVLDHGFLQVVALDMSNSIARDISQWSFELPLFEAITALTVGKPDHINLCDRKETLWILVEKPQPHILGQRGLRWTCNYMQLSAKRFR
jgi:hypothetical protein